MSLKNACLLIAALSLAPPLFSCAHQRRPDSQNPKWLDELIQKQEAGPVADPPAMIARYSYNGQVVYFLPQRCCDIPSIVYYQNGNIMCHPDGGFSGKGDMRCPDFFEKRQDEKIIWRDPRGNGG